MMATAVGPTQIDLSWTAPSDDGGSPITGYRIRYSPEENESHAILVENTGNTDTTYSDTGLSLGTTRYYQVQAINAVGTSAASHPAGATTGTTSPPPPPPPPLRASLRTRRRRRRQRVSVPRLLAPLLEPPPTCEV